MSKPWKTKKWKEKRKEIIKGKKCEWCGSSKDLSIHHEKKILPYRTHYRLVSSRLLTRLIKKGNYKTISQKACPRCQSFSIYSRKTLAPKHRCIRCKNTFDKPINRSTSSVTRKDYRDFQSKYKEKIKEITLAERQESFNEYMSLKDAKILCKKCHLAIEKNLILCSICKKRYHKRQYNQCLDCFKKTDKGKEISRLKERLTYIHPWCKKKFKIGREWWNMEANPQSCCLEHCDPYGCEIANKQWST